MHCECTCQVCMEGTFFFFFFFFFYFLIVNWYVFPPKGGLGRLCDGGHGGYSNDMCNIF